MIIWFLPIWCSIRFVASQSFSNIIETIWYWWPWYKLSSDCSTYVFLQTSLRHIIYIYIRFGSFVRKYKESPNDETHTFFEKTRFHQVGHESFSCQGFWIYLSRRDLQWIFMFVRSVFCPILKSYEESLIWNSTFFPHPSKPLAVGLLYIGIIN